jgi:hypothetical protein
LLPEFGAFVHGSVRAAVLDCETGHEERAATFAGDPVDVVISEPPLE